MDYSDVWLILLLLRDTFELFQMGNLKFSADAPGSLLLAVGYLRFTGDQVGNMSLPSGGNLSLPIGEQVGNVSLTR